MLCLECNHPVRQPALVVAMEQRDHVAMDRHAEVCRDCAVKLHRLVEAAVHDSRFKAQSTYCAACGGHMPAIRLRFELGVRSLHHIALCSGCYAKLRPGLMMETPNLVSFVDKEWETHSHDRPHGPWPKDTRVKVKHHVGRFHDMVGYVQSARGLVMPYYGYDIRFDSTHHHFFHERDLEPEPGQGLS